ncbi:MFS transporter [Massilia sp. W12]|uniref:MFS transporter n=1 Tax=Massilia sp. W12 TaxID=3126507 RepID=UPI0030D35550
MMSQNQNPAMTRSWLVITLSAAALLMVTMGVRQSMGLFVSPLNTASGLGLVKISLALAIGQFMWGAIQPVAGAMADRNGPASILALGLVLLALGCALAPFLQTQFGLIVSLGLLMAAGAGIGSFSILIGAASQHLPAEKRAMSAGMVNAGGSFGQFVFAPFSQFMISAFGWMAALWTLAGIALASLPLVRPLRGQPKAKHADGGVKQALRDAFRNPGYLLLHLGFFTCGFHIAFLVTHLPGEIAYCGLPDALAGKALALIGLANVAGSLGAGWIMGRVRAKYVLFWMYASRALMVLFYLLAPKTELTFYIFAIGLGATWLATVPPTIGLTGKLCGMSYLATLFGMTMLTHQIGGFLGAWLGGLAFTRFGNFDWMWYADIALAALAALAHLPIREERLAPAPA